MHPALRTVADQASSGSLPPLPTASVAVAVLRAAPAVQALSEAVANGEVRIEELESVVSDALWTIRKGELFEQELEIMAVAVALSGSFSPRIDEFLDTLARIRCAEVPLLGKVAAKLIGERRRRPQTQDRVFVLGPIPDDEGAIASFDVPGATAESRELEVA